MSPRPPSLAAVVVVLLAGCLEAGAPTSAGAEGLAPTESSTGIRGLVLSNELAPIAGALAAIGDNPPVLTGPDGAFVVRGLEPGEHEVFVQALGHQSTARTVSVIQGEVTEVRFVLEPLPVTEPYVELLIRDGFDVCSWAIPTNYGTLTPCPFGTAVNRFSFNLSEEWRYFVLETVWQTAESLNVCVMAPSTSCGTSNPSTGFRTSRSPNRIDGAPEDPVTASTYAMDGKRMYSAGKQQIQVWVAYAGYLQQDLNNTAGTYCAVVFGPFGVNPRLGCPFGAGFSTGIRFKEYMSVFHWEPPVDPARYSGRPDA